MNTINENEVRLANLKAVAEMRRAELEAIYQPLAMSVAKVIEDAVAMSGVTGYALRKRDNGILGDLEYLELDGGLHGIDLYYRRDWSGEKEVRSLSMGTSSVGCVKADDWTGIAYCSLLGYLAKHLKDIQDALAAIPEWEPYSRALKIYRVSCDEAETFKRKLDAEARAAKEAAVLERLVAGAEIAVHYTTDFDLVRGVHVLTGIKTMTVVKVTNKLVFFKDRWGQYKKADVVADLVRGIDNRGWSFAADVDMTFPRDYKDGANF